MYLEDLHLVEVKAKIVLNSWRINFIDLDESSTGWVAYLEKCKLDQ